MQANIWEDYISLNSRGDTKFESVEPVAKHIDQRDGSVVWNEARLSIATATGRDVARIPKTEHREGYYGRNHYNYWASGLRDWFQIMEWCEKNGVTIGCFLDIGCASGRILRHLHYQTEIPEVIGCDINRSHTDWVADNLPREIQIFQNSSIPAIPLPDGSVDFVSAFSVFTHIESFDTTWLMELRRILRPGGVAWITVHTERIWRDLQPDWPLYAALDAHPDYQALRSNEELPEDRLVFRWYAERSYSANVFYSRDYIERNWSRVLNIVEFIPTLPAFQDICILRKPT